MQETFIFLSIVGVGQEGFEPVYIHLIRVVPIPELESGPCRIPGELPGLSWQFVCAWSKSIRTGPTSQPRGGPNNQTAGRHPRQSAAPETPDRWPQPTGQTHSKHGMEHLRPYEPVASEGST